MQELQNQDRPKLSSPDNVILGVIAANINPSDVYAIEGIYPTRPKTLPAPFGLDGVAQVLEVGSNVKHLKPGDRVWPQGANRGKYQTYIQCHSRQTIPVDKRLSLTQAATLLVNPTTAYFMLKMGNLKVSNACIVCKPSGGFQRNRTGVLPVKIVVVEFSGVRFNLDEKLRHDVLL